MEPIAGLVLTGVAGYGVYALVRDVLPRLRQHWATSRFRRPMTLRERRELAARKRLNDKARRLQLVLHRLETAPDFQRVSSWAAQAIELPLAFRQRQFRRFRPRMVRHFARCLGEGATPDVLLQSLRTLLGHLGIAAFEADYIKAEAERTQGRQVAVPQSYAHGLQRLQREHQQRLDAIRALDGLDDESREQLTEAEMNRFRDEVASAVGPTNEQGQGA